VVLVAALAMIVIAGASIVHFHHALTAFLSDGANGGHCGGG
jgi:hypothetical protein